MPGTHGSKGKAVKSKSEIASFIHLTQNEILIARKKKKKKKKGKPEHIEFSPLRSS
jgi:hypothetical protein